MARRSFRRCSISRSRAPEAKVEEGKIVKCRINANIRFLPG